MSDASSSPPIHPGPLPSEKPIRLNRTSVASMICGIVGLAVPLVNIVAIVLGVRGLRQIRQREEQGAGCAIVGIVAGCAGVLTTAGLVFAAFSVAEGVAEMKSMMRGPNPQLVHLQSIQYARAANAYPDHVARLIVERSFAVHFFVHEGRATGPPPSDASILVGDYNLADFDFTDKARQRLRLALEGADMSAPVYRLGDCWFVRLPAPNDSNRLVAAWSLTSDGEVRVVYDDGTEQRPVDPIEWSRIWKSDASERDRLGLEGLERPELPVVGEEDVTGPVG